MECIELNRLCKRTKAAKQPNSQSFAELSKHSFSLRILSKIMKNAFYFTLKALFVLKIFKFVFLNLVYGHV